MWSEGDVSLRPPFHRSAPIAQGAPRCAPAARSRHARALARPGHAEPRYGSSRDRVRSGRAARRVRWAVIPSPSTRYSHYIPMPRRTGDLRSSPPFSGVSSENYLKRLQHCPALIAEPRFGGIDRTGRAQRRGDHTPSARRCANRSCRRASASYHSAIPRISRAVRGQLTSSCWDPRRRPAASRRSCSPPS